MVSDVEYVLGTYELLEHVIASIISDSDSTRKIFTIRRVCKARCDIIQRSVTILNALFTRPEQGAVTPRPTQYDSTYFDEAAYGYELPLKINFVVAQIPASFAYASYYHGNRVRVEPRYLFDPATHNASASYRNLYQTRPPCTTVTVIATRSDIHPFQMVTFTVHENQGVRFRTVEDMVKKVATKDNTEVVVDVKFRVSLSSSMTAELKEKVVDCQLAFVKRSMIRPA